jgi:hypothetical protein
MALLAATSAAGTAVAEPAPASPDGQDRNGVLSPPAGSPRWTWAANGTEGYYTLPVRQLAEPVNRVVAKVTMEPRTAGSTVEVEVRGVGPNGRWTEWRPAGAERPLVVPFTTTRVQARVVLTRTSADSASPSVPEVELSADVAPAGTASTVTPAAEAPTYPVFATREGLVGGTTANGHVIVENDRFVALPSRRALNPDDQTYDYKVRVCNPRNDRCVEAPVWDVGPWNTRDDYWNPASVREMWRDLPQGKPEATAAYYQDYNNGLDESGREVANPAGIDLADGTWADLQMTENDFVDVTYLWMAS